MQFIMDNNSGASVSKKRDILIPDLLEEYPFPSATISNLLDIKGNESEVISLSTFLKTAIIGFSRGIRMQFAKSNIRAESPSGDYLMVTVPVVLRGRDDSSRTLNSNTTWKIRINFEKYGSRYTNLKIAGIRCGTGSRNDDRPEERIDEATLEAWIEKGKEYYENEDYKEAIYWFRKAADQRYANAQNSLGYMYKNGKGVAKDYKKAVYWFRKAA